MRKVNPMLLVIFFASLVIRFLYFPSDISFTFDQARDAFVATEVASGDFKIIGPPSTFEGVFHGALYYYVVGPLYKLSNGNPELVSAALRVSNALGLFLVFFITKYLFNKRTALIAATLFAFSFEQTQYALFLGHPSLAVLTVLLFYLGLTILFVKKDRRGLMIAAIGLGLSIQFHFSQIVLFIPFTMLLYLFRKTISTIDKKTLVQSLIAFGITISTFILAEFKFNFRTTKSLFGSMFGGGSQTHFNLDNVILVARRFVNDNVFYSNSAWVLIALLTVLVYLFKSTRYRTASIILTSWLLGGLLIYLFDSSNLPAYQYSIAGSVSLIILTSFLLNKLVQKRFALGLSLFVLVIYSNISLIRKYNPGGNIVEIIVQDGMLLSKQKDVLDYVYQKASGNEFSVGALSNPYKVTTTWSYLFEWYGSRKYNYLPVWGGDYAKGFLGNMEIVNTRSDLPRIHFVIIEPSRGIYKPLINKFINEEDIFSEILEEQNIGEFKVQFRQRKG